ncbi:hypothetical protein EV368DRAFT_89404 [Lentinula lateritia]|nr:hypothetical protein EV368DRAFT_89404 [Lentinula lateritia]
MNLSQHEQWHTREYHRCIYERALDRYEDRPEDANLVYELVWAFTEAEVHPMPDGGIPLAAFPLDCYDLLEALPEGALSSLPRTALAVAIGWTRELLKKLALERGQSVVMFEEGDGESGSRVVVYFGGNRFANLLEALEFLFEYWQVEPSEDDRDRDHFSLSPRKPVVSVFTISHQGKFSGGRQHRDFILLVSRKEFCWSTAGFRLGPPIPKLPSPLMSTSRTTMQTTPNIGSIPVTAGHGNQPPAPTRPTTPSASDEERELEEQLERNRERLQKLKEKRKAEEAAKKKAEEEAARQAAEEKKKKRRRK